jgi:hypothetical protein
MAIKLSTWSCLEIRLQDQGTIYRLTIFRLKELKYLGTTIMNKNSIQEEIRAD